MMMKKRIFTGIKGWFVALPMLVIFVPRAAFPADAIDPLNVKEPERPGYIPSKPGDVFQLPPVQTVPGPRAGGEALVNRIAFRGNVVIPGVELEAVAAPYAGRRLNEAELEELRQKLTRYYIDRGYINSGAILGKDAIADGMVTFDIVEGRLSELQFHGLERLHDDYLAKRLVKDDDAALNVDVLHERFQLLLDDPLFERLNARLMPGARLGDAALDVDVVRARPYQLTASVNNYRPPSIGSTAYELGGWVRNLTGYGDLLKSDMQYASLTGAASRYSLAWNMPLNQRGTQLSAQLAHGQSSVIEEPMRVLDISSILDSRDFGISHTFIETLRHKLTLGLNRVERENQTTLLGQPFSFTPGEPNGLTKVSAWRFWQEYAYRSESQVLALRSTFTSARNNLQDIAGLPSAAAQPEHRYSLWLGQIQYARQVLENGAQVILRGSVQETSHLLVALDRMSIGGVQTVRGYRENQLIRDKGNIVNLEFDYPSVRNPGKGFNLALVPFYDIGRGQNQNEAPDKLSSWGLATRIRWQGLALDFAVAKRLTHPDLVTANGGTLQDKGVHVQLSYDFF